MIDSSDFSDFSPIAVIFDSVTPCWANAGPILRMFRDLSVSRAWLGV
jgi:hypothetical protein